MRTTPRRAGRCWPRRVETRHACRWSCATTAACWWIRPTRSWSRRSAAARRSAPAGLTAAVYAASEGLETIVLERGISGGQIGGTSLIRNFPGFTWGIGGRDFAYRACERDGRGYIITGLDLLREGEPPDDWPLKRQPLSLETSLPGVFAAGDVRQRSIKRVASAAGEGATAVQLIHQYLGQHVLGPARPRPAVEPVAK